MSDFFSKFDSPDAVLDLETPDLAGLLLQFLHETRDWTGRTTVMRTSLIAGNRFVPSCKNRQNVASAVVEAWSWLIREGMIVPYPLKGDPDHFTFSRLGEQLKNRSSFDEYRQRLRCPKELLHSKVVEKAWPIFLRGEYDTAIFQAFKEVEVAVRVTGGFGDTDFGVNLMEAAFRPARDGAAGRLTDPSEPPAEQKSLMFLFSGAYGRVRNPTAHRHGVLTDPIESFEMLVVASHLLRVVDRRRPASP